MAPDATKVIDGGAKKYLGGSLALELMAQVIEQDTDLAVRRHHHAGESAETFQKFLDGDIDFYVEASGTLLAQQLGLSWQDVRDPAWHTEEALNRALRADPRNADGRILPRLGPRCDMAVAMLRRRTDELGLTNGDARVPTLSELAEITRTHEVTYLTSFTFHQRPDGYRGLVETYDLRFALNTDFPIHDGAAAKLATGETDATEVYTTDPILLAHEGEIVLFEDDRQFFPPYHLVPVASASLLEREPAVDMALSRLHGRVTARDLQELGYAVQREGLTIVDFRDSERARTTLSDITRSFLTRRGL